MAEKPNQESALLIFQKAARASRALQQLLNEPREGNHEKESRNAAR
jgi:hypothetical protein